jgi:hypothetical protein
LSVFFRFRKQAAHGATNWSCWSSTSARLRAITLVATSSFWLKYSVAPQQFQSFSSSNPNPNCSMTAWTDMS